MSVTSATTSLLACQLPEAMRDYQVLRHIAESSGSNVFLIVCLRGRLRNRQLAMKKIPSSQEEATRRQIDSYNSIHQSLHHPSIVSLYSVFLDSSAHYQILELCTGNLSDLLFSQSRPILQEDELRRVLKCIVDALLYLKKERVVHRGVSPSSIFLTENNGVKLSNFENSVRLEGDEAMTTTRCETSVYSAPEIISDLPHSYPADLWSLSCVAIKCLTGNLPTKPFSKCLLSVAISQEMKEFIASALQVSPEDRMSINKVHFHPLFEGDSTRFSTTQSEAALPSLIRSNVKREASALHFNSRNKYPSRISAPDYRESKKSALEDIRNLGLRDILSFSKDPAKRIVSDPVSSNRQTLISEIRCKNRQRAASLNSIDIESLENVEEKKLCLDENIWTYAEDKCLHDQKQNGTERKQVYEAPASLSVPVGTTRPISLNTSFLAPKTTKAINGHITVLPSRCLLIDFRESQRRRGLRGNEVLVVSPKGTEIKVYDAPHLSTPCCLVEPTQQYILQDLPAMYWKQYNDAWELVDQIKRRTPKLIQFTDDAKNVLMANEPLGDIEILLRATQPDHNLGQNSKTPKVRLRFSRRRQSIEIARYIVTEGGEEWIKKTIPCLEVPNIVSDSDWTSLESAERQGIRELFAFLRTCKAVEREESKTSGILSCHNAPLNTGPDGHKTSVELSINRDIADIPSSTSTIANSICSIKLLPRPSKLPYKMAKELSDENSIPSFVSVIQSPCEEKLPPSHQDFETKFTPSIGWCIRYKPTSQASHPGIYKIMFLDGAMLQVDVDKEVVEFKPPASSEVYRYHIRECLSKPGSVTKRIKAFEEFVSLFDDSQELDR